MPFKVDNEAHTLVYLDDKFKQVSLEDQRSWIEGTYEI
jgi:hypothetical protein